ncbi:MAG: sugar ABC transporter permease [Chloroflexi bacterium]|nr:sugar ABC transporter permease [Chloroflexota bacterium]MBV9894649.1 sugar ABC transporter permease [Chloroflexota bacterium]
MERGVTAGRTRVEAAPRPLLSARVWSERSPLYALVYLLPFLVVFVGFHVYPIFYGLYVSLTAWDLLTPPRFVGLSNYAALAGDRLFLTSLRNTALFVVLDAPMAICIPLGLALLVNERIPLRTIFRSAFVTPLMISASSVGVLWQWIYNPALGLVNYYAQALGLPGQSWMSQAGWATFAIVITTVWATSGFNLVLFLAGLQNIPEHLYDAAKVDGAGAWALFRNITLPGLRPTTLFVTVTTIIGAFRVFVQVLVMTNNSGGPFDSTRTVVMHLYQTGFQFFRMGGAAAVAWVLFLIILVFTIAQFQMQRGAAD